MIARASPNETTTRCEAEPIIFFALMAFPFNGLGAFAKVETRWPEIREIFLRKCEFPHTSPPREPLRVLAGKLKEIGNYSGRETGIVTI